MIRAAFFVLTAVFPGLALAQSVPVRSGEHGDFTRLVFDMPEGTEWTLEQDIAARRVTLRFGTEGLTVDPSRVFSRIDRSRLAEIVPSDNASGADLTLSCACSAEAFVLRDRMLVVDIRPATGADPTVGQPRPEEPRPDRAASAGLAADLARVRVGEVPGIGPARSTDPLMPHLPGGRPPSSGEHASRVVEDEVRHISDAAAIGEQLAADLAAAATEGILDAAIAPPKQRHEPSRGPDAEGPADDAQAAKGAGLVEQLAAGLSDVDHAAPGRHRIQVGGLLCVPDAELRVADWADPDADINEVLANRRSSVFGEFDRVDEAALIDYAKSLLHYGFGAEARATLDLSPAMEADVLNALSHLVDGQGAGSDVFANQTNCPGDAALWSVLALPEKPGSHPVDTSAVLRAFETLPVHLREHLGPTLSNKLSGAGYPDAARDALNRLQRSKGMETDSIALERAQIDLRQGDLDAAEAPLRTLAIEGGAQSPEALLASIKLAKAAGKPVPGYLVELADAYAMEFRNSEDGGAFWQAHIEALVLNGAFQKAYDRISVADGNYVSEDIATDMHNVWLEALVKKGDDVTFLKLAMRELADGFRPGRDRTVLEVAERLLVLGLPDAALQQASMIGSGSALEPEVRILRARALTDLGRIEEAEILLIGQTGDDVTRLRADLRNRMGDHELAGTMYSELGEGALARQEAWLSGDWNSVADGTEDPFAKAAALVQSPPDVVDPANPSLAVAQGLSDSSVETRETIRALLEATQLTTN